MMGNEIMVSNAPIGPPNSYSNDEDDDKDCDDDDNDDDDDDDDDDGTGVGPVPDVAFIIIIFRTLSWCSTEYSMTIYCCRIS